MCPLVLRVLAAMKPAAAKKERALEDSPLRIWPLSAVLWTTWTAASYDWPPLTDSVEKLSARVRRKNCSALESLKSP